MRRGGQSFVCLAVLRSGWGVAGIFPRLKGLKGLVGIRVASLALVADLCYVARVTVHVVSHLLQAAVGKVYVVGALGVVSVAGLLVAEVVAGGVILHGVVEVVLGLARLVGFVGLIRHVLVEYYRQ